MPAHGGDAVERMLGRQLVALEAIAAQAEAEGVDRVDLLQRAADAAVLGFVEAATDQQRRHGGLRVIQGAAAGLLLLCFRP